MLNAFNKLAATVTKPNPDPTPLQGGQATEDHKLDPSATIVYRDVRELEKERLFSFSESRSQ